MTARAAIQDKRLSAEAKADIQGFITSGFGHLPFGAYLFVEFLDRTRSKQWLNELLPHITSASSWRSHPGAPKSRPERTLNIAFTFLGLRTLGVSEQGLASFPTEYRDGMASTERSQILGDTGNSAPEHWEFGGPQNAPVHALLVLNARTRSALDAWCSELREALNKTQGGVHELQDSAQFGARPAHGREHFGFFDGIGQPQIEGIKGKGIQTGEFILGYQNAYGFYPPSPIVPAADDPQGILQVSANPYHQPGRYHDLGFNGTYVVYRKLAQDVAGFWRFLQAESIRMRGVDNPHFMIWLASKMVGRWPSGSSLTLAPDLDRPELRTDDFLYAQSDPLGLACPFGSHIRRTNPRDQLGPAGEIESLHMTSRHRILRRGKPYGPPLFDPEMLTHPEQPEALQAILELQDDGQPRGVHFLCANASLKGQFEFIQQAWVNNPHFNGLVNNRDPLVGDNDASSTPGVMLVPSSRKTMRTSPLPRFVTVRGGVYLFMPSLVALRYLAQLP